MDLMIGGSALLFLYLLVGFITADEWEDSIDDISKKPLRILVRILLVVVWPAWWVFLAVMFIFALIGAGFCYLFEIE